MTLPAPSTARAASATTTAHTLLPAPTPATFPGTTIPAADPRGTHGAHVASGRAAQGAHGIDYPTPDAVPASRATWTFEPARAAVLVHDLQRYFVSTFATGSDAITRALAGAAAIVAAARAAGVPVLYTAQDGTAQGAERGLQGDLWGAGMRPVPEHTAIVPEVAPAPGDTVLTKHRYSAFARTDLAARLAAQGRDQLVVVGVYAHIGVLATAFDAFQREVRPFVVADAVADFSAADHARALATVAGCTGVVTTVDQVVGALTRADGARTGTCQDGGHDAGYDAVHDAGHGAVGHGAGARDGEAPDPVAAFDAIVRDALATLLPAGAVAAAFADPHADVFALGLDSVRAFDLLDVLAEAGVDVDFGEFTRVPTVAFLRAAAGVGPQPSVAR